MTNTTAAESATFEVTADLSYWASMIADGTIKRAEIAVMPTVKVGTTTIALNAPSKTFDLVGNAFIASAPIVDAAKCNKCHDALATSFHSADRGGNVTVCRVCHTGLNGGSHLEMQSRSIDSYVHAIHSFQAFDVAGINFADPVQTAKYGLDDRVHLPELHAAELRVLPRARRRRAPVYGVPDQSKSLPGVLSASAPARPWPGTSSCRASSPVPARGPAARATAPR